MPVPLPGFALEMVPRRPSREIVAAISSLYLAALIPALFLLLGMMAWFPTQPASSVVVVMSVPIVAEAQPKIAETIPEPKAQIEPRRLNDAQPQEIAESPLQDFKPLSELPLSIEIDGLGTAPRIPVLAASASIPNPMQIKAAPQTTRASELVPIVGHAAPIDLPRLASAPVATTLPAVSLAGPAPVPALEGVPSEAEAPFRDGLGTPATQAIAVLPGPVGSQFRDIEVALDAGAQPDSQLDSSSLDGVPLEILAACDSREREDRLKQELMLEVRSGGQCTGAGGSYSFLEARNLNAFLMRVARDTQRELGNRCDELIRAQACVTAQ